ncbi:NUDIX domain-containing protein [Paenisporosarcina sp. TG20]|uniref:NUDIX hydrolase n=1 Tax=Paenisporosarcina sp. TG20 TaxID=1211706 RepID=UPI0002FE1E3D|nr:NUDIX domain-containing protein [Paenisporosarcina sp. TG20]
MEQESLSIFDENHQKTGKNTRAFIHQHGLWHETFHCWFVHNKNGVPYLYFQQRSEVKKDFPNLFDITAAGHILATETVNDGIREVKEEIGVNLNKEDLQSVGIIKDSILQEGFIDNEFAHTFIYIFENENLTFHLQKEEVSGIFSAPLLEVIKLYDKTIDQISLKCVTSNNSDFNEVDVTLQDFVPHGFGYMNQVLNAIRQRIDI